MKDSKHDWVRSAYEGLQCCFACLESILKYITRNAYIEVAMFGTSFCRGETKRQGLSSFLCLFPCSDVVGRRFSSASQSALGWLFWVHFWIWLKRKNASGCPSHWKFATSLARGISSWYPPCPLARLSWSTSFFFIYFFF
jgi:Plasma-membrane choline transporter.